MRAAIPVSMAGKTGLDRKYSQQYLFCGEFISEAQADTHGYPVLADAEFHSLL